MRAEHTYEVGIEWTGAGTTGSTAYSRDHEIRVGSKQVIPASADPTFRGDPTRVNPEELFVASVAECHMLWFLFLAARSRVVVTGYTDDAVGTLQLDADGAGRFTEIVLRPRVRVAGDSVDDEVVARLHEGAHDYCYLARSLNCPTHVRPVPLEEA